MFYRAVRAPSEIASNLIFFMPPTSEKLKGHIALGLSVCPSVRPYVRPFKIYQDTVLKIHIWIPHLKIIDTYFLSLDYLPLWSYVPLKGS